MFTKSLQNQDTASHRKRESDCQMHRFPGDYDEHLKFSRSVDSGTKTSKMILCDILLLLLAVVIKGISSDSGTLFSCSFDQNTCGMKNQIGSKAFWKRTYLHLGGRSGYGMAVTGNDANNHFARFMTPDFDTNGATTGCITFRYFIDGLTPVSLACIKQGFVTQYVFATARKTQDHWEKAEVDVEFLGDKVMFYFEADTKVQEYGNSIVAFTDVQVTGSPCSNPQAPRFRILKTRQ